MPWKQAWKQTNGPLRDEWVEKMCSIHAVKYYLALKKRKDSAICTNMDAPSASWWKSRCPTPLGFPCQHLTQSESKAACKPVPNHWARTSVLSLAPLGTFSRTSPGSPGVWSSLGQLVWLRACAYGPWWQLRAGEPRSRVGWASIYLAHWNSLSVRDSSV